MNYSLRKSIEDARRELAEAQENLRRLEQKLLTDDPNAWVLIMDLVHDENPAHHVYGVAEGVTAEGPQGETMEVFTRGTVTYVRIKASDLGFLDLEIDGNKHDRTYQTMERNGTLTLKAMTDRPTLERWALRHVENVAE